MKKNLLTAGALALTATFCVACGGSDDEADSASGGGGPENGVASGDWADYCVATFTKDFDAADVFGDPMFTAKEGDSYLVSRLESPFSGETELLYLTGAGPEEFEAPGGADAPYTTDCLDGSTTRYIAAFDDVTVYEDEELTSAICELSAGDTAEATGGSGYSSVGFELSGPATYSVMLSGFSEQCGGASEGYISVPETKIFGTTTWLVPLRTIEGPAP